MTFLEHRVLWSGNAILSNDNKNIETIDELILKCGCRCHGVKKNTMPL